MNIDDLMEAIRQCNYYSLDQVLFAIVETNGKISVIPKSENAPATAQDVKVQNPPAKLPHIIVSDGKLIKNELDIVKINMETFNKILKQLNVKKLKDLIILSLDDDGKLSYQIKNGKLTLIQNIYKEMKL